MFYKGYYDGLYYEVKGSGYPIIFLHGIGGSHHMFDPQVEELSKYYMTITVDLKGNGKSESVNTLNYLDVHVDSILGLITYLNINQAVFIGLSYGGIVTQVFSIKHPDRVSNMVLIDTYAQTFPKDAAELKLTMLGACVVLASWFPKKLLRKSLSYIAPYHKWELAQQELLSISESCRAKDITIQMLEVFNMNLLNDLMKLNIPSLIIVGDQIESVVNKNKEIDDHLRNSKLMIVENSVDPTNLCQPEFVNRAILDFLKELNPCQF
nr:alpha/beta hydrolase [Neobacillus sp. Marseille-Q6967]